MRIFSFKDKMHRHFPMVRFGEFVYNIDSDMHARDGRAGKLWINQSDVGPTLSVLSSNGHKQPLDARHVTKILFLYPSKKYESALERSKLSEFHTW